MKKKAPIFHHLILFSWSLVVFFPVWTMIINSFKGRLDIYKAPFGLPPVWDVSSYLSVLKDGDFLVYFQNSLFVTLISLGVILLLGSLAAYGIVNFPSPLGQGLFLFFIAGMMIPIRIGSINLLQIIKTLGLLNKTMSLLPIYIAMGIPIAIFVLTQFIREIPKELSEAAFMDGASPFRIYHSIVLPLTRPALGSVAIFNLVPIWNDLWFPLIFITEDSQKTLILGVARLFGQYQTDWSRILAALTLSAMPVILLYLLMSKQFIRGLTAGAVKG